MLQSGRAAAAALLTRSVRLVATSTMQQVTAAAAAGDAAARYHSSTAASSSSSSGDMQPGAAFLASLIDYEKVGIPQSAGVAGSSSNAFNAASSSSSSSSKKGFNLQTMHNLLAAMGNPHKQLKVVHVAGTKGKGSVVTMLSNMLQNAGYKVGTYTSPHMFDIRERILVGGGTAAAAANAAAAAPVTEQQWEDLAAHAAAAVQNMSAAAAAARSDAGPGSSSSSKPSHFEVVTAMAFRHFANEKVDIAVIETGLGGSTDATNVWNVNNNTTNNDSSNVSNSDDQLQVSVITAIGRDHLDALGGSISSIATAKAGIMKSGVPVVVADQRSQCTQQQQQQNEESNVSDQQQQQQQSDAGVVWSVLRSEAERLQCPVIEAEQVVQIVSHPDQPEIMFMPGDGYNLARQNLRISASLLPPEQQQQQQQSDNPTAAAAAVVVDLPCVSVQLVGAHQKANAQAAVAAALLLRQRGWRALTAAAIQQGLEAAWLPGRFQVIKLPNMSHHLVLDGAHTGESAAALAAAARAAFRDQPLVLLLAMAADKQHREVCESLRSCRPNVVIFTSVPIAGSHHRSAPPGTLAAHWQAAAILSSSSSSSSSRPFRCRELIQANLGAALEKARHELAAFPRGSSSNSEGGSSSSSRGVVLVTGSLHAVAAALKHLELAP